jgi:hypothetical protein
MWDKASSSLVAQALSDLEMARVDDGLSNAALARFEV